MDICGWHDVTPSILSVRIFILSVLTFLSEIQTNLFDLIALMFSIWNSLVQKFALFPGVNIYYSITNQISNFLISI